MATIYSKQGRDWLNDIESCDTGSIQWSTEVNKYGESSTSIDSSITLRDCSRQIELDFCSYGKKDFIKKMKKLNLLKEHLENLTKSLEEAYELCKDEWEKRDED